MMETPDKHCLGKVIKVNLDHVKSFSQHIFFPNTPNPNLIMRLTSDKFQKRYVLLKTVKMIKNKRNLGNCHCQKESKER